VPLTRVCAAWVVISALGQLVSTHAAVAQVRVTPTDSSTATWTLPEGIELLGPPPPVPPAVESRDATGGATVRAVRVREAHRVDGVLDESVYAATPPITGFIQTLPVEGDAPSERTEAWIVFDDENVYVAARVWDSGGESAWIANEMRRDAQQLRVNDNFGVYLDTYYDRRNSVGFYVNALGGFTDQQITNEGNPNRDWNPVTEIRTGRFEGGWTVEMAIPFRTLRYRPGREQLWGIQMRRSVARRNEWDYLTPVPIAAAGPNGSQGTFRVSNYGTLVGIEAPPSRANLELKPYAISGLRTDLAAVPTRTNDLDADAGLDIKYGLTQNLTVDFTLNPDFAQVEADEQQVNLTRFSLFFPEKREFFLESQGIFNFGIGGRTGGGEGGGGGGGGGNAPSLFYSRGIGLRRGQPVPIIAGARVTGKVGSFDVGVVDVQTDDEPSVLEKPTNFSVLRLRRDVFDRSSVGFLVGNRSRSVKAAAGSNQTWGLDAWLAPSSEVGLLAYYAETRTDGLTERDASYRGQFTWDASEWGARVAHLVVGGNFNPEIGFARRTGYRQTSVSARVAPRPRSMAWLRQVTLQADADYVENDSLRYVESRELRSQLRVEFENSDQFGVSLGDTYENLVRNETISGALIPSGRYSFRDAQAFFTFGPQRPFSATVSVQRGDYYDGTLTSVALRQGRAEITPRLSMEPSVTFNWIDLPQGHFDQHVAVTRFTYTLTPRMFVSSLVQYNSGSDSFSSDFRLRWEWAPGSELFVVYTEARDTDSLDRWSELVSRGLVIKVNRLLRM